MITYGEFNIDINNGNQFLPAMWASVSTDVRDLDNWEFYSEDCILPPDLTK